MALGTVIALSVLWPFMRISLRYGQDSAGKSFGRHYVIAIQEKLQMNYLLHLKTVYRNYSNIYFHCNNTSHNQCYTM